VPLDEAVRRAFDGRLENAMAVVGVLAADRARRDGFTGLRAADAAWPAQKQS
jgi:ADP-ribose pyrophosphatase